MAINFDVVPGLEDVDTIEHVQETLSLEWDRELIIDKVKEDIGCLLVWGSNSKVIALLFEYNALASDDTGVEAGFVNCGCQTKVMEDCVGMFLPETG